MKIITEAQVHASNDRAVENGYDLFSWSAEEIAVDLADYDSDFEGVPVEITIPFIRSWFVKHGRTEPKTDPRIVQGHDHHE